MGTYTELIFGATLKENTPERVLDIVEYLVKVANDTNTDADDLNFTKLDHPFFTTCRWRYIFCTMSVYFGVYSSDAYFLRDVKGKEYMISARGNLKNYDNEIELFADWIKPFVEDGSGKNNIYVIQIEEESIAPKLYCLSELEEQKMTEDKKKLMTIEEWNIKYLPQKYSKEWKKSGIECPECKKELNINWTTSVYAGDITYRRVFCIYCRYKSLVIADKPFKEKLFAEIDLAVCKPDFSPDQPIGESVCKFIKAYNEEHNTYFNQEEMLVEWAEWRKINAE